MTEYFNALPSGYRLHEYLLMRVLGAGGFGITYLGFDKNLDKPVAIKEFLPLDIAIRHGGTSVIPKSSSDQENFEWGLDRFLDESRTLAMFDHNNICKIFRFFQAHGTGYIVMEYVEGEILSATLKRKGRLNEVELRSILEPLLDGLKRVHEAGFLHRDIKPHNIVIRDSGSPVLIDFGAARQAMGQKSRSVTAVVTPGYAPIEQYSTRGNQGPWTDIYALGAVCYRAVVGTLPPDAT
jgi:serine/threonine protein kinase